MLSRTKSLLPSLVLVGLLACQRFSGGVPFTLDNPTSAPLQVQLDGASITLNPKQGKDLTLRPGAHTLVAPATGPVSFLVYARSRGGLINPTLSPYVTVQEIYATDDKAAQRFRPFQKTVTVQGVDFSGPLQVSDSLFIDRTWQFGVHEPLPDKIRVGRDSRGNIQGKVYDLDAFVAYHEGLSGQQGRFARERKPQARTFTRQIPTVPAPSGPAEWDAQLAPLRSAAQRYLKASSASEQEALQKEFQKALISVSSYVGQTAHQLGGPENTRRDAEFRALIDIFSHGTALLP